jgi:DNA-binding protein YbaB
MTPGSANRPEESSTVPIDSTWIEQVQADSLSRLEAVERMQQQLQGLTGTAASSDSTVQVTVTPAGALVDLHLDERALRGGAERLAAEILALTGQATAEVAERVKEIVAGVIPETDVEDLLAGQVPASTREDVEAELAARRGVQRDGQGGGEVER